MKYLPKTKAQSRVEELEREVARLTEELSHWRFDGFTTEEKRIRTDQSSKIAAAILAVQTGLEVVDGEYVVRYANTHEGGIRHAARIAEDAS